MTRSPGAEQARADDRHRETGEDINDRRVAEISLRLRRGELTVDRVAAAAGLGDPVAGLFRKRYDFHSRFNGTLAAFDVLTSREQRRLACDFAERGLAIFERSLPGLRQPHAAIETARRHLAGEADFDDLDAARQAVFEAVVGVDGTVALIDAPHVHAAQAAGATVARSAFDALRQAEWTAILARAGEEGRLAEQRFGSASARSEAWNAGKDAEREWQRRRLLAVLLGDGELMNAS